MIFIRGYAADQKHISVARVLRDPTAVALSSSSAYRRTPEDLIRERIPGRKRSAGAFVSQILKRFAQAEGDSCAALVNVSLP